MEIEDTVPWYRQFWPWFVFALPAFAVVAGLFTLWLALQGGDSLVFTSSDGMNVITERNLKAESAASTLGLSAIIDVNSETGAVLATMQSNQGVDPGSSLLLQLRHPTMANRDRSIELARALPDTNGDPTWAGHFVSAPVGRYFLTLSSGDVWRLSTEWVGQNPVLLGHVDTTDNGSR